MRELRETLRQQEAFNYYYALGEKRTLSSVAAHFGFTQRTAVKWSVKFNWQERVAQRDIEIGRRLQEKMDETVIDAKASYRKIIKAVIARWVQKFKDKEIDPENVLDLERLIKLDLLLMGEATERNEQAVDVNWKDDLLSRLDSLATRYREGENSSKP